MSDMEEGRKSLRELADEAAEETNRELEAEMSALMSISPEYMERLVPQGTSQEEYENLIAVVNQATRKNESAAQLTQRLKAVGGKTLKLARTTARLMIGI